MQIYFYWSGSAFKSQKNHENIVRDEFSDIGTPRLVVGTPRATDSDSPIPLDPRASMVFTKCCESQKHSMLHHLDAHIGSEP